MKKTQRIVLCGFLIALNLGFIWGNSAMTGESSGGLSDKLLELLFFLPQGELGGQILRKAAHFTEFACLGVLMGWMCHLVKGQVFPWVLGLGLCCACIDETIQHFVPGRASSLLDVWLDSAGFAVGLAIAFLGYTIISRKQNHLEET